MENVRDLLLEIGSEELPARFCQPALEQLQSKAVAAFAAARLSHGPAETFGTPRRLVLLVHDLSLQQADLEQTIKGPPARIAYDADGAPTKALEGFLRTQGVKAEQVFTAKEGNADYVFARKVEVGGSIAAVLPDLLANLITGLEFPKSMRWGDRQLRFARPLKWILALLGNSRVPFEVDGMASVAHTFGHRFLAPPEPMLVANPREYFIKVNDAFVLVDQNLRRNLIWQRVQDAARELGGVVKPDDDLLDEVNWLVEQPYPFHGSFDAGFLRIPKEVLVTSMREHQRFFPVYDADGAQLLPHFVAVRNGLDDHLDVVRAGNEKVLRARLADANFFFEEDLRLKLADRVEKLKGIVFQEKLGTLYDKVQRTVGLAGSIAHSLGADPAKAQRAALLCKADLTTAMVHEFPELQGVMGREYARLDGEAADVAAAIFEHYQPRGAGDDLPQTPTGVAVALADKLDTLAGYFSLGLIPKGSADPFALRRAAQGVVAILIAQATRTDLRDLLLAAIDGYPQPTAEQRGRLVADLQDFLTARLKVALEDRGIRYDVVEAVLARPVSSAAQTLAVAETLNGLLQDMDFASVMAAFKRVANLGAKAESRVVDPLLLAEPQEKALFAAANQFQKETRDLPPDDPQQRFYPPPSSWTGRADQSGLAAFVASDLREGSPDDSGRYAGFYKAALSLKAPVDDFLDKVLVMAEDPAVRRNRLALLAYTADLLSSFADLSKLVLT